LKTQSLRARLDQANEGFLADAPDKVKHHNAEIPLKLERLNLHVENLTETIAILQKRLQPILAPEPGLAMVEGRGDGPRTPIGEELEKQASRLSTLNGTLDSILSRLEV